jgi:plastocyanin
MPGNSGLAGVFGDPPAVGGGQSLHFENFDAHAQVFHTVTACAAPCNRSTGISYPLADGAVDFDSAELGYGPTGFTAASNHTGWDTPASLKPGTYTYFCRIHPYMRGSFRVK